MKHYALAFGLLACGGVAFADEQIYLRGFHHEDAVHVFRVSRRQLHAGVAWDPEVQPLRFDLYKQINRAREACLITNEHRGEIDLWEVSFWRNYAQQKEEPEIGRA